MTSKAQGEPSRHYLLSSILSRKRQRYLLAILDDEDLPLTERDLAVQLAAVEAEKRPENVAEAERVDAHRYLHHVALPKATAAGIIDRGAAGVQLTERFDEIVDELDLPVPDRAAPNHRGWDVLATVLERPYRLDVLNIVSSATQPCSVDELASELADTASLSETARLPRDESSIAVVLHHVDLPKLADADLLEYDAAKTSVRGTSFLTTVLPERSDPARQ